MTEREADLRYLRDDRESLCPITEDYCMSTCSFWDCDNQQCAILSAAQGLSRLGACVNYVRPGRAVFDIDADN